jgi:hypothetical protein
MGVVWTDPFAGARLSTAVAIVGENVEHMPVLAGTDLQRQDAGRFQSRFAITLGLGQQSQAGAVAVFMMFAFLQQACHCDGSSRADVLAPLNQSLRRPFHMRPVGGRYVISDGTETTASNFADVTGDALHTMEHFNRARCDSCFQYLTDQGVGDAVPISFDFDVIVDMYPNGFEIGDFVALRW